MSFHNSINIAGKTLKAANKKVSEQNALIMAYYALHPYSMPTPWQIHDWLKKNGSEILITSVRRSLTDLSDAGKLIKSDVLFIGPQGKPNHAWILNVKAKKKRRNGQGIGKTKKKNPLPNEAAPKFHQQTLSI
jgi:hypothetical protein